MEDVKLEIKNSVLILTIHREEAFNALNRDVIGALREEVVAAAENPKILAVVITGSGEKAFSAGADLKELQGMNADEAQQTLGFGQNAFRDIEKAEVPVIAAVNGMALGGGFELILASTIPVIHNNAKLGLPEASLGLIPGYGGTQRLSRIVGENVAAHLMLTSTKLTADRAYELGLTPVPPVREGQVIDVALQVAEKICKQGPGAVKAIIRSMDRGRTAGPDSGLQIETGLAALAVAGEESTEGINAFINKRQADFRVTNSAKGGGA